MTQAAAGTIYRFRLADSGGKPEILKAILTLAVKETELIYGKARLKLETSYTASPKRPVCEVEGGTECGDHLAKLLTGFLIKKFGEQGFRVERLSRRAKAA